MDSLIYEDTPHYGIWMKAFMVTPLALAFFLGLEFLKTNDTEGIVTLLSTIALMFVAFWVIFPRKYCILDSKIKIVLGKPLSFSISFKTIETARVPQGLALGINFATSFSAKDSVEIVRKRRLNVNITPSNPELFIANLDKALTAWKGYTSKDL